MKKSSKIGVWFTFLGMTIALISFGTGCERQKEISTTRTEEKKPAQGKIQSNKEAEDEIEFFDRLTRQPKCTVADAIRAVCILAEGKDIGRSFSERYNYLKNKGIVKDKWQLRPDDMIDRGSLAYMLCKIAGIKGGIDMFIFGKILQIGERRYAYRELVYRRLMDNKKVDYSYVSGPELTTIIGKVDRFMEESGKYHPPVKIELGKETQYIEEQ